MSSVTLGCTTYSKTQTIRILQNSTSGDMTYQMAAHLAAAKLNISCSNTDASCVSSAMAAADAFLCAHPAGSKITASSKAWQQVTTSFNTLVKYNEGKLCAPARK
jgi:hypothetical protein